MKIQGRTRPSDEVLLSQKHARKPGASEVMGEQGGDGEHKEVMRRHRGTL